LLVLFERKSYVKHEKDRSYFVSAKVNSAKYPQDIEINSAKYAFFDPSSAKINSAIINFALTNSLKGVHCIGLTAFIVVLCGFWSISLFHNVKRPTISKTDSVGEIAFLN